MLTREVPGNDLTNDTQWFVAGVNELAIIGFDSLALNLVCPARIVSNAVNGTLEVSVLRPIERLAVIESFDSCELVLMLLHKIRKLVHELGTLGAGTLKTPASFESVLRSGDSTVDILGSTLRDLSDQLASRRVDDAADAMVSWSKRTTKLAR